MKRAIFLSILAILSFLTTLARAAEPSKSYWFEGYIYGTSTELAEQRARFVPVALSLKSAPKNYLAIAMTDGAGFFRLQGIPIDYQQKYLITLLYGTQNETYQATSFDRAPSKVGPIVSDIKTRVRSNFYTTINLPLNKQKATTTLESFLKKNPNIQVKSGISCLKGRQGFPSIFINGKLYYANEFAKFLQDVTLKDVAAVKIIRFKKPHKMLPGAIDIKLKEGDFVPLNPDKRALIQLKKK